MKDNQKKRRKAYNQTQWTSEMIGFLKDNYRWLTNKELANHLGLTLTVTRSKLYELGLKRMEMEYWTKEQIDYLVNNYQSIGDVELAEIFNKKWNKKKGWTKKHIEKKRRYLKLKRTQAQQDAIHQRNVAAGRFTMCPLKAWAVRGITPIGTIRLWKHGDHKRKFIKTDRGWEWLSRFIWELFNGPIENGHNIIHIDGDPLNCNIENLRCVSHADLMRENSPIIRLTDNYVASMIVRNDENLKKQILQIPELIELKRQQLKLNRAINEQGN